MYIKSTVGNLFHIHENLQYKKIITPLPANYCQFNNLMAKYNVKSWIASRSIILYLYETVVKHINDHSNTLFYRHFTSTAVINENASGLQ